MAFWDYFKRGEAPSASEPLRQVRSMDQELLSELTGHAEEDEKAYPQDVANLRFFRGRLRDSVSQHVRRLYPEGREDPAQPAPVDAASALYLSEDRMSVYLCLLPPLSDGENATVPKVLEDLRFEGVTFGVEEAAIKKAVSEKLYLRILPVARGKKAKDGTDAKLTENFIHRDVFKLEAEEGSEIDFGEKSVVDAVHKGEVICRLTPATPAEDGMDVAGLVLRGRVGAQLSLPRGQNTSVSKDRTFLLAEIDGVLSSKDGLFHVERQKVIFGDMSKFVGNLDYPGSVLIKGNVQDALTIKASGDIIIEGTVRDATVISGGSVRIQQGIQGKGSSVRAAGQVQCKVIEEATVSAGGSIFAEAVVDSTVSSGASLYLTGERGLLVGGTARVRRTVEARRIGNQAGNLTTILLNYNPDLEEKSVVVQKEHAESKATLETLRTHVLALRKNVSPNPEQRALLSQLTEQRELYEEKVAKLAAAVKTVALQLNSTTGCAVKSEEILPTAEIRLGEKHMTIQEPLHSCRIRVMSGALVVTQ